MDYRCGLVIKKDMPQEVKEVIIEAKKRLKKTIKPNKYKEIQHVLFPHKVDNYFDDTDPEYSLPCNYDSLNFPILIFNMKKMKWNYREPYSGYDKPCRGGKEEAINHLITLFEYFL